MEKKQTKNVQNKNQHESAFLSFRFCKMNRTGKNDAISTTLLRINSQKMKRKKGKLPNVKIVLYVVVFFYWLCEEQQQKKNEKKKKAKRKRKISDNVVSTSDE